MEKKSLDLEGRYNSTCGFVHENKLEKEANECFGVGWEPEFDVEQIAELIEFIGAKHFFVSFIEGLDEDDILVTYSETSAELEKYKKGFEEVMCYFDSISDEEQPKLLERLKALGL